MAMTEQLTLLASRQLTGRVMMDFITATASIGFYSCAWMAAMIFLFKILDSISSMAFVLQIRETAEQSSNDL